METVSCTQPVQHQEYQPGAWVRPLGTLERFGALVSKYQCYNTVQAAWLSSSNPISADAVADAIRQVTSKCGLLQCCITSRFFRLWFRKMERQAMDFTVVDGDPMRVYYDMLNTPFDLTNGPLWKARLVPLAPSDEKGHQAVLLLSIQHSITDGTTNLLVMRDVLKALNAIARGQPIDWPRTPFPEPADRFVGWRSLTTSFKTTWQVLSSVFLHNILGIGPYRKVSGVPGITSGSVRSLCYEFSEASTSMLLKRCKGNGVTLNCCVIAAARLALFRSLQTASNQCKKVSMSVESCVNIRRYLGAEYKEAHGYLATTEGQTLTIQESDFTSPEAFWELAESINKKQKQHLDEQLPLYLVPMFGNLHTTVAMNYWFTSLGWRNVEYCHILANSLGDLDKNYFSQANPTHIKIDKYMRGASSQYNPQLFTVQYHTLGGCLNLSIEQFTNMTDDKVTQAYLDQLIAFIYSVAETGTIPLNSTDVIELPRP